jgi:hypothetical protein
MRPDDDDVVPILEALRWQREYVLAAGSTTAALVLEAVGRDIESGGGLGDLVPVAQRFGDLPGLRIMAAVHRLALDRAAPAVARWLPTLGGIPPRSSADEEMLRREVVAALLANPDALADSLTRTPQTNETGRAALLRCVLSRLDHDRPVRLREIGASAGLNLRADHLPGQPDLESGPMPTIRDRIGCDLSPVDIGTPEGRALLGSYVWVDDVDRFRRLADAMTVAAAVPASVVQMDAAHFVAGLALVDSTTTVVWHSAMWVYLPATTQHRILEEIDRLGSDAGPGRSLVHASWEWAAVPEGVGEFALVTRTWAGGDDDGRPVVLATGMSHGHPARLVTPAE